MAGERLGIVAQGEPRRSEIAIRQLAGTIVPGAELGDALRLDVEPENGMVAGQGDRKRQADPFMPPWMISGSATIVPTVVRGLSDA